MVVAKRRRGDSIRKILRRLKGKKITPKGVFRSEVSKILYAAMIGGASRAPHFGDLRNVLLEEAAYEAGFIEPDTFYLPDAREPVQAEVAITPRIERYIRGLLIYPIGLSESQARLKDLWLAGIMERYPFCFYRVPMPTLRQILDGAEKAGVQSRSTDTHDEVVLRGLQQEQAASAAFGAASIAAAVVSPDIRDILLEPLDKEPLFETLGRIKAKLRSVAPSVCTAWYSSTVTMYDMRLRMSTFGPRFAEAFATVPRPEWCVLDEITSAPSWMAICILTYLTSPMPVEEYERLWESLKMSVRCGFSPSIGPGPVPPVPEDVIRQLS